MPGELVKAKIQNTDTGDELEVCFNPREYSLSKNNPWVMHKIQGMDAPEMQWTSGGPFELAVEFLFDAYEKEGESRDVRTWTDKLETFALVNADKHRPPILLFVWGEKLQFKAVITSLGIRFTMFLENGTPVRATANVTFTEFTPAAEQLQSKPRHSPDHTKRRVVRQGDTLSWIAGKEYGNPAEWRVIAQANGIEDPMRLTVGQELLIPPLY